MHNAIKKLGIIIVASLCTGLIILIAIPALSGQSDQRFTDNGDGTVTDNVTGVIWLKNASRFSKMNWDDACEACKALRDDGITLTDGSQPGDWRLANVVELNELHSVIASSRSDPAGHPFTDVKIIYWTSDISVITDTPIAKSLHGPAGGWPRLAEAGVWCVRGRK